MTVRLILDRDVCMGAGYCAKSSPRLFTMADDGIAELRGSGTGGGPVDLDATNTEDIAAARHSANICPAGAITVIPHPK